MDSKRKPGESWAPANLGVELGKNLGFEVRKVTCAGSKGASFADGVVLIELPHRLAGIIDRDRIDGIDAGRQGCIARPGHVTTLILWTVAGEID